MIKKSLFLFGLCGFLVPLFTSAHVKWFAETSETIRPYRLTDWPVLLWLFVAIVLVGFGFYLEKKLPVARVLQDRIRPIASTVLSLANIGFGFSFIIFSINGFVFAPNLVPGVELSYLLLGLQLVAGVMILIGWYERIGAALIVILFCLGIKEFGLVEMIDTLEMLGFAIYVLLIGRPKWHLAESKWAHSLFHRFHVYGVPILRVGTGLNLLVLGFTEKILAPGLTHNFLGEHHWNFMSSLGMTWFSDYWFAFSAGVTESLIGIFLILGLITRTTTIILAVFLSATLVLLGPIELIGHLPHFSIAIVLLLFGSGARLKATRY
ncbi:MAG TPA: hypothetical protein VK145_00665 [Candidatus Nanoarchaeia archaeon]|nr:hypothetical protein [Candidatus Nanoarchaeia archaeon]